jgi:probable phosphoglycerate mutase
MLLFYVRHADPIYNPNSLTPLGIKQAQQVAKRLALYGLDKIYASPSERAMMTARATAEITKLDINRADFADEAHVWRELTCKRDDGNTTWLFQHPEKRMLLSSADVRNLGDKWYEHPELVSYKQGIMNVYDNTDSFMRSLGYEHERYTGRYKALSHTNERIALFAHQGFGLAFLSCLLDIPYPAFCTHFNMSHSNVTVINFEEEKGYSIPCVLTLSNDSHIYRDGLPTKYNNRIYF